MARYQRWPPPVSWMNERMRLIADNRELSHQAAVLKSSCDGLWNNLQLAKGAFGELQTTHALEMKRKDDVMTACGKRCSTLQQEMKAKDETISRLTSISEQVNSKMGIVERLEEKNTELKELHEQTVAQLKQTEKTMAEMEKRLEVERVGAAAVVVDNMKMQVISAENRRLMQELRDLQGEMHDQMDNKSNRELCLAVKNNRLYKSLKRLTTYQKLQDQKNRKKIADFTTHWSTKMRSVLLATNTVKAQRKKLGDSKKLVEKLPNSEVNAKKGREEGYKRKISDLEATTAKLTTRNQQLKEGLKRVKIDYAKLGEYWYILTKLQVDTG